MIGYKVVQRRGEELVSVVVWNTDACVVYTPHKKAVPSVPDSRILAFVTLEDARAFRFGRSPWEIWKAELEDPQAVEWIAPVGLDSKVKERFQAFWIGAAVFLCLTPWGTVGCTACTLLEKVE